jgi:hypothetical protein
MSIDSPYNFLGYKDQDSQSNTQRSNSGNGSVFNNRTINRQRQPQGTSLRIPRDSNAICDNQT